MSLAVELKNFETESFPSKVEMILEGSPPGEPGKPFTKEELIELREIVDDRTKTSSSIHRMLRSRGFIISVNSIRRYRSGV